MISELLKIGDQVTVEIEEESRMWGYNPCPNGTVVTVIGFSEHYWGRYNCYRSPPGVYESKTWVKVQDENGKVWSEYCGRLHTEDEEERREKWFEMGKPNTELFLRDLPEDKFIL